MRKKEFIFSLSNELPQVFAVLLAFFIPVLPKIVPLLIVLMVISVFLNPRKLRFHKEYRVFSFLFTAFYSCYLLGMTYSHNTKEGLFDLEVKLSFLVIPLFFLFHGPLKLNYLRAFFAAFVTGCLAAGFVSLNEGLQCYFLSGDTNCFFSSFITPVIHASYLAVYVCFAILIVVHSLINYVQRMNLFMRIFNIFLIIYFSVFILLLSSKGGLLALLLVIIVSVVYYAYKNGKIKNILLLLSALILLSVFLFSFSSYVRMRFSTAIEIYKLSDEELFREHHQSTESSAVRLMIWKSAGSIISENPLGVGTGDNKINLLREYKKRDMTGAYGLKLNCHNQYLETTLSVGFQGLIMLALLLLYGIYHSVKHKNFLLLWVTGIVSLNLFFESFFERQAGVVFFVFVSWILFTSVSSVVPVSGKKGTIPD